MKDRINKERILAIFLSNLVILSIVISTLGDGSIAGG